MPTSQGVYTPPNNFVQQYDQGQKKIRADLVDENFTDAAAAITQNITDIATAQTTANNAASAAAAAAAAAATAATTTALGRARLATPAEVQAGAAAAGSVTPAVLDVNDARNLPKATVVLFGLGRSATDAEAAAGATSGTGPAFVTPEQLGARAAYLVETWHSGTEWYRVWSDGWIEQGGITTAVSGTRNYQINFNKAFTDTNYFVTSSAVMSVAYTGSDDGAGMVAVNSLAATFNRATTTSVYINYIGAVNNAGYGYGPKRWYACGY